MENETEQLDIRPLLLKRFVWDIFPHDFDAIREVQQQLGLVPDGAEGAKVEHELSDKRLNRVGPLDSTLRTLSDVAAEVVGRSVLAPVAANSGELEVPDGFYESFRRQNGEIIRDSALAIIAHLLDTGVLEYGQKVRDV